MMGSHDRTGPLWPLRTLRPVTVDRPIAPRPEGERILMRAREIVDGRAMP
jgi:hypothetical protein